MTISHLYTKLYSTMLYTSYTMLQYVITTLYIIGEAHYQAGNEREAENAYRLSLQYKPDHLPAHLTMARFMNRQVCTMYKCYIIISAMGHHVRNVVL